MRSMAKRGAGEATSTGRTGVPVVLVGVGISREDRPRVFVAEAADSGKQRRVRGQEVGSGGIGKKIQSPSVSVRVPASVSGV